jgi:hypothetical protein
MRQRCADTLATEEPDALIAHVRVCGGAGWVTIGSTRQCAMKRELGMDEGCRVTATYRTSQKSRIVNMGSSRRDGKASGIELRGDPARNAEAQGVAVWA